MSDQSEALRLADELDTTGRPGGLCGASAIVLRRQHSRIEADEALMRQALNLLSSLPWNEGYADDTDSAITALRKRLESST